MVRHRALMWVLVLSLTACGALPDGSGDGGTDGGSGGDGGSGTNPLPTQLKDEAEATVKAALTAGEHARAALEALGLLPVYECGEPRGTFVGRIVADFEAEVACVTIATGSPSIEEDTVTLVFAPGCAVGDLTLEGTAVFSYNGGEDRMDVAVDLSQLVVDDIALDAAAGYGTCADETRYWVDATGAVPGQPGTTFSVDGSVASRSGPPIIGGTTLIIDGTASLTHAGGTDSVTFTGLVYEKGDYLPKEGTLRVTTASGHTITARFSQTLWRIGQVEITVDSYDPVTIPIVR